MPVEFLNGPALEFDHKINHRNGMRTGGNCRLQNAHMMEVYTCRDSNIYPQSLH